MYSDLYTGDRSVIPTPSHPTTHISTPIISHGRILSKETHFYVIRCLPFVRWKMATFFPTPQRRAQCRAFASFTLTVSVCVVSGFHLQHLSSQTPSLGASSHYRPVVEAASTVSLLFHILAATSTNPAGHNRAKVNIQEPCRPAQGRLQLLKDNSERECGSTAFCTPHQYARVIEKEAPEQSGS